MSKSGFGQMYRKLSSKLLDLIVTPHVLGEVPTEPTATDADPAASGHPKKIVCYVLQNHSRSNALLVDGETRRLKLAPALDPLVVGTHQEKASIVFLQHNDENNLLNPSPHTFPPRLLRLVEALEQQPDLDVELVPVTVLWGRSPDKEDSWFKLLFTDTWATPSTVKQLMNIGLHGRQSFLEFHESQSLRALVDFAKTTYPNLSPATYILNTLNNQLDAHREAVLGPDLSDRRNVMHSLIKSNDVQEAIRRESIRGKISMLDAERRAIAGGNQSTTMERHIQKRDAIAANAGLTTSVTVLGLLIVAISLVGLVNAITMSVIERTREIGMLRCVGARAKDVRRIFTVEGLTVAVLGWLIGVALGWAMGHGLVSLTASLVKVDLFFVFPAANIAITLIGTVVLTLLVLLGPVRRAIHLKPGDALRYA